MLWRLGNCRAATFAEAEQVLIFNINSTPVHCDGHEEYSFLKVHILKIPQATHISSLFHWTAVFFSPPT